MLIYIHFKNKKNVDLRCVMLKRKATAFIENWIQSKEKKCLVVQGACVKIGLNQEKPYK